MKIQGEITDPSIGDLAIPMEIVGDKLTIQELSLKIRKANLESTLKFKVAKDTKVELFMTIQASSAGFEGGNHAEITINGFPVQVSTTSKNNDRGLHIIIINPLNGRVELAQVFDTFKSSTELEKCFISHDDP